MAFDSGVLIEVIGNVLLFVLVFGMTATVNVQHLKEEVKNAKAILAGLFLQFIVMPLLGFIVVSSFNLDLPTGVTLLVITSSPGGSYSNWWCSLFNADLALSVTMTAISTLISSVMLPLNLLMYASRSYDEDVVSTLNWGSLAFAILIVIFAIGAGILASAHYDSQHFQILSNRLGNVAGVLLVIFSVVVSSVNVPRDARLWNRGANFYFGVALPCFCGLLIATALTTALKLWKPERVAVSIECCYQNIGIATSVALSMFRGDDRAAAVAVPLMYGIFEAIFLLGYGIAAWKLNWTKAPADVPFWKMLFTSYEVLSQPEDQHHEGGAEQNDANEDDDYYMIDHQDAEAPRSSEMVQVT